MNVLVIHEKDTTDNEHTVIGVCDSVEHANELVIEYYGVGNFKDVSFSDIRDSNIECQRVLCVNDSINGGIYNVVLTYEWFELNK